MKENSRKEKQSEAKYPQWEQESQHVDLLNQLYFNKKTRA